MDFFGLSSEKSNRLHWVKTRTGLHGGGTGSNRNGLYVIQAQSTQHINADSFEDALVQYRLPRGMRLNTSSYPAPLKSALSEARRDFHHEGRRYAERYMDLLDMPAHSITVTSPSNDVRQYTVVVDLQTPTVHNILHDYMGNVHFMQKV